MLKTNTKKVMEALKKHIGGFYGKTGDLLADMRAVGGFTPYHQGRNLAEGGAFLCYCDEQREFLREALEETHEEADRFSDDKVFELYCHLIGRACEKLAKEN